MKGTRLKRTEVSYVEVITSSVVFVTGSLGEVKSKDEVVGG